MNEWLIITLIFMVFDLLLVFALILKKSVYANKTLKGFLESQGLFRLITEEEHSGNEKMEISRYFQLKKIVTLDQEHRDIAEKHVNMAKAMKKHKKGLHSFIKINRIESAVNLGLLGSEEAREELESALAKEKDSVVKLYIANALSDIGHKDSLPVLVLSLLSTHLFYRERTNFLIADFGRAFDDCMEEMMNYENLEIKELLVDFSSVYYSENTRKFLKSFIMNQERDQKQLKTFFGENGQKSCRNCTHSFLRPNGNRGCKLKKSESGMELCRRHEVIPISVDYQNQYKKILHKAYRVMAEFYPKAFLEIPYAQAMDAEMKEAYVYAVAKIPSEDRLEKLISFLKDNDTKRASVHALSVMLENYPSKIATMTTRYQLESDEEIKRELSKVLASRLEYFIMKLKTRSRKETIELIKEILLLGRSSEIIDFLNKNRDIEIENELVGILKEAIKSSPRLKEECSKYLHENLIRKCNLEKYEAQESIKSEEKDKKLVSKLYGLLAFALLLFPMIFILRHGTRVFGEPLIVTLKTYIIEFNYYMIYYAMSITAVYFLLLLLSYSSVNKQVRLWRIKNKSLMFKKKMLPTISIVAPAYNEEKTVLESVKSLLNLEYPEYELILVNDGSKDRTLDVLIRNYDLKRVDFIYQEKIATKPVRGIYMNSSYPKLIVVDKENGGKGDSLNTGINISTKEYFCGIDADSVLESDALLKLASMTLDQGVETPALGGNILPVNGSTVTNDQLREVRLPQGILGKLQTIEYTRAFKAGRLGWAKINGLLIISGAFGLFRTKRVISAGGYLTKSGEFHRDTVGEDMELVVRIARSMKEKNLKYKICNSYNANCWTEVPEDLSTLKKQRYRWHKGLIDNLTFHSRMLFNPRYGVNGLLSMPYFFIYEMMGSLIEAQGMIMVVLAYLLGLLNKNIAILLFVFSILSGILISTCSLVITEKDSSKFSRKDILTLSWYAVLENLGPRQLISLWRAGSFFNMMKKPVTWDKAERKGFLETEKPQKPMITKDVLE